MPNVRHRCCLELLGAFSGHLQGGRYLVEGAFFAPVQPKSSPENIGLAWLQVIHQSPDEGFFFEVAKAFLGSVRGG